MLACLAFMISFGPFIWFRFGAVQGTLRRQTLRITKKEYAWRWLVQKVRCSCGVLYCTCALLYCAVLLDCGVVKVVLYGMV